MESFQHLTHIILTGKLLPLQVIQVLVISAPVSKGDTFMKYQEVRPEDAGVKQQGAKLQTVTERQRSVQETLA
ncbi:hypothetical protein GDO81_016488 [Engystomops pustulosus]|uniref:Uncharacterized protein n=1 Tax=Engystomops pustulosus TaxID=76066 RepID=A0AAV7ATB2_ENGPU|nr:hypothetical protein GDO81_016488 [Engystomops pustulosus]